MKDKKYVQAKLVRGTTHQTTWIDIENAISAGTNGRSLALKEDDGTWDEGWSVITFGSVQRSWAEVNERGRDFKETRRASDV